MTYKEIARELGKPERTIFTWFFENKKFKREFEKLKAECLERARNLLLGYGVKAAYNLIRIAEGEERGRGSKVMLDANINILDRIGLKEPEKQELDIMSHNKVVIVDDIGDED